MELRIRAAGGTVRATSQFLGTPEDVRDSLYGWDASTHEITHFSTVVRNEPAGRAEAVRCAPVVAVTTATVFERRVQWSSPRSSRWPASLVRCELVEEGPDHFGSFRLSRHRLTPGRSTSEPRVMTADDCVESDDGAPLASPD